MLEQRHVAARGRRRHRQQRPVHRLQEEVLVFLELYIYIYRLHKYFMDILFTAYPFKLKMTDNEYISSLGAPPAALPLAPCAVRFNSRASLTYASRLEQRIGIQH